MKLKDICTESYVDMMVQRGKAAERDNKETPTQKLSKYKSMHNDALRRGDDRSAKIYKHMIKKLDDEINRAV